MTKNIGLGGVNFSNRLVNGNILYIYRCFLSKWASLQRSPRPHSWWRGWLADPLPKNATTTFGTLQTSGFESKWPSLPLLYWQIEDWFDFLALTALAVSRMRSSVRDRTFAAAGPQVWNSLPPNLRLCGLSYGQFRRLLKTFLFGQWGHVSK